MKIFAFVIMTFSADAVAGFSIFGGGRSRHLVYLHSSPSSHGSELAIQSVRKAISRLNSENFSDTLVMIEPFLLDQAGASFYKKSMNRIKRSAKSLDVKMPDGFAKEAKATAKARARQEAFIQTKNAEVEAAALAAAPVEREEVTA
mmetsp:Transcript_125673/g.246295  ORF Transcript_125673/g.246295 Transcript_125673/m.246295 type:complete len:146 (-) Transcript_125673:887-1324(-)